MAGVVCFFAQGTKIRSADSCSAFTLTPPTPHCFPNSTHLKGSADFHHVVLFHYGHPEVVGLHQLLKEGPVALIFTP